MTLLIQVVSVPVFLSAWGVRAYGEWLVLSAVPTYLALSDLSFSSVAGNLMTMLVAQGNRAEAVDLGRRLWSIVTTMTGAAVLAAVAVALVFGGAFGPGAAIAGPEARVVLIALFLQVAVGNQYGVLDAWYRAGSRYPLGTTMRQIGRLLEFGALMGVVLLGAGPAAAAISFLIGSLIGFVASWIVLRRAVPWSSFRLERPHLQTFRELLTPGLAYMAWPISQALSLGGFTIVVRGTLGAAAVVVFSTTRTVTRLVLQAVSSINSSIWPELSRSVGGGNLEEARTITRRATQATLAVSLSLVLPLALLGPAIIRTWTHGRVDPPRGLWYVLLLVVVASSAWNTISTVILATNRHKRMGIVYVSAAIVAVVAAIPLSATFGLVGAAMALLATEAGMGAYVLPSALRVLNDQPGPFLHAMVDVRGVIRLVMLSLKPRT